MRHLVVAFVCLLSLVPLRARAQDDVHALLASAVAEYDAANYQEAYALFLRVHQLQPSARSERALGKASFELRHYRECVEWLEASLADERSPLTDEMRAEVEALLVRARAFIGRFVVQTNVEGAILDVDGAPIEGATVQLDLGEHEIVARADGYEPIHRRVTVQGGEDATLEITLVRAGALSPAAAAAVDPGATYRDFGWASVIAGIVLAVGGAVAIGIWASAVGTLNANLDAGACFADASENVVAPSQATCFDLQNRYRLTLPFAFVGFIGGGLLLATGLGLVLGAPGPAWADRAGTVSCDSFADVGAQCTVRF